MIKILIRKLKTLRLYFVMLRFYRIYKIKQTGRKKCRMCDGYYKKLYILDGTKCCEFCINDVRTM